MYKMQRMLLALLTCLCSTTLFAQIDVKIDIKGIDKLQEDNVRLFLSIEQQKNHALMSEGRLRRLHQKAPQEISKALQPFGYYRPVIDAQLTQPGPDSWLVSYSINPGPPLPVARFDFSVTGEMSKDPAFASLVKSLPLNQGAEFNHLSYESIKANLAKLAAERGYFDAGFSEHRVEIDLKAYEARVILHYDSGPRYLFGEVTLHQDVLDAELVHRYIPFEQGDPYTLNQVIELQQALNDSDYFNLVEVSPEAQLADSKEVPVNVILTPRKRHKYTLGLGYGTDTGARTKFGWEIPRLNQRGHRINSELKISEIGYSISSQYRVPVLNPRTDQIIYSAGIVNEETDTSISTIYTVGASLNRNHNTWRETLALNYQQEEFEVADDHGRSTLLMPGVNWSRIWGSRRIFLNLDGIRLDLGMRGASDKIVSDTNFFQATAGIKAIHTLWPGGRLIGRGKLGSTWTDSFHQLPSSVRFFTGGSQSVRGFGYQTLGPVDDNGKVVGGKHLMIGSLEYEHRIKGKWSAALFFDRGNAIDAINDPLESGAGLGLRWQSPVGPIRFDYGWAISRDGNPWRFHINIGPDL